MKKSISTECDNIAPQLSAYFDRQMPVWKRHLMKRHLNQCAMCKSRLQSIQQADKLLKSVEPVKASDTFLSEVLHQAANIKKTKKIRESNINRIGSRIENMQLWLRGKVRAYNPIFMFGFIFAVFVMVGATLYSASIKDFNPFPQFVTKSTETEHHKLITFEVIQQQEPKRILKSR